MSDVVVSVVESVTTVSVTESSVNVNVVESPVQVTVGSSGPQGAGVPDGGSAGQFLAKASGTDYDTSWVDHVNTVIQQYVKNDGVALLKGQAVYVSGANGTNIIVQAADNSSEATSSKTLGLLLQDLAINAQGWVITEGLLSGLNTSAATAGDAVWLGTNGNLIFGLANKPSAPAHLVYLGVVTRAHATQGEINVKVQNGFELQELHNVAISSPSNNQVLSYDSATSLWKNTAGTVAYASTSGTAVYANTAGSATPTAHAASHGSAGSDAVTLAQSQVTDLTSDLAARALLTGVQTFTGQQTIQTSAAANKGLIVKASASQTANIFETQASDGSVMTVIGPTGTIGFSNSGSFLSAVSGRGLFITNSASTVPMTVQGAVSQSVNLFEIQNSSATVLVRASASGQFTATGFHNGTIPASTSNTFYATAAANIGVVVKGAASQSANLQEWQDTAGTILGRFSAGGSFLAAGYVQAGSSSAAVLGQITAYAGSATVIGAVIRGAASQSANLQEWQNSTGTVLAQIYASGSFGTSGRIVANGSTGARVDISTTATTAVGLGIRAVVSQTANLLEAQDSTGTVLAYVSPAGSMYAPRLLLNADLSARLNVGLTSATQIGAVIRGAASQSANLQEWQNSAGTVLANVTSAGGIGGAFVRLLNNRAQMTEENTGGKILLNKATAASTNPGSGVGAIYFRDGTNAGTLKLVVRAGAAGAETTILDNIPQ